VLALLIILIIGFPSKPVTLGVDVPSCSLPLSDLPDVNSGQFRSCRTLDGRLDPQRFYDSVNNWTVLPLNPRIALSAQQVCIEYCSQTEVSLNQCISEDQVYLDCLAKLFPNACSDPAYPVARNGSQDLFVVGRGLVSCY